MGLDIVDLIVRIEKHFQITIPDREAEKIVTVQDIFDLTWKLVSEKTGQLNILRSEVDEMVRLIIADHTGLPLKEIQADKTITTDLGLD